MISADDVKNALSSRDFKALRQTFRDTDVADIAELFSILELDAAFVLFRLVPRGKRAEVFSFLPLERQEELLDRLPDNVVTSIVSQMEPVDRTKLLEELPFEITSKILAKLAPDERNVAWQLLSYPEDSVGRIMTPVRLVLRSGMSAPEAIEFIRWHAKGPETDIHTLYVTDNDGHYLGDVSLAALVMADPQATRVEQLMTTNYIVLHPQDDEGKAVDMFRKYDRAYFPVIDENNILVGMVEADDLFDVAEEEATEEIQAFGGQSSLEDSYFQTPLATLVRKRAGWLSILFVGELFTGTILREYDEALASMRYLVYFVPLIISSGGNSGSQAASLVIRGIAVREMQLRDWHKVFGREVVISTLLGLILGVIGYARAVTWGYDSTVGLIIFFTLIGVVIFGAVIGAMLPFAFKTLKLDPAVGSSPFIASLVDMVGIVIFLNIALTLTDMTARGVRLLPW